jgi:hypothetical protein
MKQVTINTYQFDELSDDAKEKAREWWRELVGVEDWSSWVYDDAAEVGIKITGFDIDRGQYCKGDLTEGAETVARKIIENHGENCETHKTAKEFLIQLEKFQEVEDGDQAGDFDNEIEELEEEFQKSIFEDYRMMLEGAYEDEMSDEHVDDTLRINEYEFTADGKRFVVKREAVNV